MSTDLSEIARLAADSVPTTDGRHCADALEDLDRHGLAAIVRVVRTALHYNTTQTEDEIAERLRVAPRHRWLLRRWLRELTARGLLEVTPDDGYGILRDPPAPVRRELREVCAELGFSPQLARFFAQSADRLPLLLRDRVLAQELLFPDGDFLTAEAAYRTNPVNGYLNVAVREFVSRAVRELAADHAPVRILELGAGVGGTTADIVAALAHDPVDYHFTDLSNFFLAAARDRFTDYPWMRYGILDLNRDLPDQPPCDIVLAANVLHNAQNSGELLTALHELLNPGGYLIFVESCREHCQLLVSMHFLMSARPGGTQPGQHDVRAGTDRIFLHENEWLTELTAAGLTPLPTLPPADHPLAAHGQRLFVARKADRTRPGGR
ncbi:class I SAM-dependent methyltransferase [Nocardia sp. CDC160]|uniref:class I SAM-dependent methyltransferase n=1 Tax=Nocardia sp. CDC160 TaxID=3112166 RepID=UPI002DBD8A06|nr:class I SAM-dependent methyltransferase [Nocardia sp. CDC160]MEC3915601.1 class I SAM-dependent methyltransferase [Nocardia sp. CDC160]